MESKIIDQRVSSNRVVLGFGTIRKNIIQIEKYNTSRYFIYSAYMEL